MNTDFRHLDLCSGIGGFALASLWMNWQTIQFCEIDPFCQKVLAKNFPGVPIHDDLTTYNARPVRGAIDILTAGYPCQPFSHAGRRLGEKDPRHLWPHVRRIIVQARPAWCVLENVAGHVSMGLDKVCAQLEAIAYSVQPVVIPACATGAPHRRDRVWIIARRVGGGSALQDPDIAIDGGTAASNEYVTKHRDAGAASTMGAAANADSQQDYTANSGTLRHCECRWHRMDIGQQALRQADGQPNTDEPCRCGKTAPDPNQPRTQGRALTGSNAGFGAQPNDEYARRCDLASPSDADSQRQLQPQGLEQDERRRIGNTGTPDWAGGNFGQPSPLTHWRDGKEWEAFGAACDVDDGIPARLVRCRVSKLKALGNAIVPQVAYQIFQAIKAAND